AESAAELPPVVEPPPVTSQTPTETPPATPPDLAALEAPPPPRSPFRCARGGLDHVEDIAQLDLETLLTGELTSSVSRSTERADDAPATVTVVTRDQIRLWGYQSVAEV